MFYFESFVVLYSTDVRIKFLKENINIDADFVKFII